jgi:hypothetical protein
VLTNVAAMLIATAASAPSPLETMRACTSEKNESVRLACYDRAMAALNPPPAPLAAPAPPQAPPPMPARSPPNATPSMPAHSPPQATPATPAVADEFGMTEELRRKRNPGQAKPDEPQELRAQVVSVARRQGDALRVELDNGQVWIETEHKAGLVVSKGDTVTIKPGLLGSYFLALDSGVGSRVKRVR